MISKFDSVDSWMWFAIRPPWLMMVVSVVVKKQAGWSTVDAVLSLCPVELLAVNARADLNRNLQSLQATSPARCKMKREIVNGGE